MHKLVNGIQVPLSPEEIKEFKANERAWKAGEKDRKLKTIREKRNALLAATDVKMLPDYPGDNTDVIAYRQALRDITKQEDLDNLVWPKEV